MSPEITHLDGFRVHPTTFITASEKLYGAKHWFMEGFNDVDLNISVAPHESDNRQNAYG